jgi:hypothetical protein
LRDELAEAKRKLEYELRQNQKAYAEIKNDDDLGRRCMAITDAVEDEIDDIARKLAMVENSL